MPNELIDVVLVLDKISESQIWSITDHMHEKYISDMDNAKLIGMGPVIQIKHALAELNNNLQYMHRPELRGMIGPENILNSIFSMYTTHMVEMENKVVKPVNIPARIHYFPHTQPKTVKYAYGDAHVYPGFISHIFVCYANPDLQYTVDEFRRRFIRNVQAGIRMNTPGTATNWYVHNARCSDVLLLPEFDTKQRIDFNYVRNTMPDMKPKRKKKAA